jgi:hypothetical protein
MTYQIMSEAQLRFEAMTQIRDRADATTRPAGRIARTRRTLRRRQA